MRVDAVPDFSSGMSKSLNSHPDVDEQCFGEDEAVLFDVGASKQKSYNIDLGPVLEPGFGRLNAIQYRNRFEAAVGLGGFGLNIQVLAVREST